MSQQIIIKLNMSANNVCTGQLNHNVKGKRTFSSNEFAQGIFERNIFVKIEKKLSIIIVKVLKTSQKHDLGTWVRAIFVPWFWISP